MAKKRKPNPLTHQELNADAIWDVEYVAENIRGLTDHADEGGQVVRVNVHFLHGLADRLDAILDKFDPDPGLSRKPQE